MGNEPVIVEKFQVSLEDKMSNYIVVHGASLDIVKRSSVLKHLPSVIAKDHDPLNTDFIPGGD